MLQPMDFVDEIGTPYPTVSDFFKTFNEEMRSLYLLSFLLTADQDKAEQCLVSAMGKCVDGIDVSRTGASIYSGGGSQTRDPDDHASTGAPGLRVVHKSKGIGDVG